METNKGIEVLSAQIKGIYDNCKYPDCDLDAIPDIGFFNKVAKAVKIIEITARIDEHCIAIKEHYTHAGQGISGLDTPRMRELQSQLRTLKGEV